MTTDVNDYSKRFDSLLQWRTCYLLWNLRADRQTPSTTWWVQLNEKKRLNITFVVRNRRDVCWLFQDNVLAAEKPPDAPSHEADSTDVFLKKDDFLFDPFDQWKGPQGAVVSENDVFMFDESTAPPPAAEFPEKTVDLEQVAPESE